MASLTQMIVGNSTPNLLIAEDLLKILRDSVPSFLPKSPINSHPQNGRATENTWVHLSNEMNWDCHVNSKPLTS